MEVVSIGEEAFYVVDDDGFRRHIDSEHVDRQVLDHFLEMVRGHEELISESTMKMLGQEDIFTKAAIESSLKSLDDRFEALMGQGFPDEMRAYLGMLGFKVVIDVHGSVVRVDQPSAPEEGPE